MWRRIPIIPMLFGALVVLALLSFFSIAKPEINDWHVFAGGAAVGAGYVVLLYAISRFFRVEPRSTARAIGRGCLYAGAGYSLLILLAALIAIVIGGNFEVTGYAALASLIAFAGLGILGGVMLARFRRSEAERQKAALEAQAAAFAHEQLALARDLQQRLLPPSKLETDRFCVTARNVPAAYVAGDFYDFVPLGEGRLLIVLADVAGKGVGAGLIMATVKAMIPLLASEQPNPAPLLGRLNERFAGQLPAREFVAMTLALYDANLRSVTVANAGLPDPLLVASSQPIVAGGPRYPIGIKRNLAYESVTAKLAPGDRLILFTDGLPEAPVRGEPLGYERLGEEVQREGGDIERLFASLEALGAAHDDDWTAVLLEAR